MKRDYYQVLGVARDASDTEIKRSYRKLAVQFHPDRNPDNPEAEAKFKEASEAYSVLIDENTRARYDRGGHQAFEPGKAGPGFEPVDFGAVAEILDGLLGDMLGGRRSRSEKPPADIEYQLSVSFEEAALGATKRISVIRPRRCNDCGGTGAGPNSNTRPCRACQGRGEVRKQRGIFGKSDVCVVCRGSGTEFDNPCEPCDGEGIVEAEEALEVGIPPGVADGAVRTLRGAGSQGTRRAGDLHVNIAVEDHDVFRREGPDIHCSVSVSYPEAVLGTTLRVPTLTGSVQMKLPAGTPSGKTFRLRGKGVSTLGGYGKGDQLVHVVVDIPENPTAKQRAAIQELGKILDEGSSRSKRGIVGKIRSILE